MKCIITIHMDTAAFADGNDGRTETARLVEIVARKLKAGSERSAQIYDSYGNKVGRWAVIGGRTTIMSRSIQPA